MNLVSVAILVVFEIVNKIICTANIDTADSVVVQSQVLRILRRNHTANF